MVKRPFLLFMTVMALLVSGVLFFIQTPQFAWFLKQVAASFLPRDLGVAGDFKDLSVRLFPPGFTIREPRLTLGSRNVLGLPGGSTVSAERIEFRFRAFQVFSGDVRVHEVIFVNGEVLLIVDGQTLQHPSRSAGLATLASTGAIRWDELLHIRADSVGLENVKVKLQRKDTKQTFEGNASQLRLAQWEGHGGLGYSVFFNLNQIHGSYLTHLGLPGMWEHVEGEAFVNVLGLQLESLFISNPSTPGGLDLSVFGKVRGNVLEPKSLEADLKFKAKGEIPKVAESLGVPSVPKGLLLAEGRIQGDLVKPLETLDATVEITGREIAYQGWQVDQLKTKAHWKSQNGGEVTLEDTVLSSPERPRVGGHQPGNGGEIRLGSVSYRIGSPQDVRLPLQLKRAHLHWLAGLGALKDIYALDLRLTGSVDATFRPKVLLSGRGEVQSDTQRSRAPSPLKDDLKDESWQLEAVVDLIAEGFQLDNQRYLKKKPLSKVFQVPKVGLKGPLIVNKREFRPMNLVVSLPETRLSTTGKLDFKTGWDLYGTGPMNLADLNEIAENKSIGKGFVAVHVHGPASRTLVDLDADFKGASYLDLDLGDFKGRITWDDDPSYLIFHQILAKKNSTRYEVNGMVDVGLNDRVNLTAQVSQGDIQDFIVIFKKLVDQIGWFPKDLVGPVKGTIEVAGGLALDKLKVMATFNGQNWVRWNEKFKTVAVTGGYDSGSYVVKDFNLTKRTGKIKGKIAYSREGILDWKVKSVDLSLGEFDQISQLELPIRGKLELSSFGRGKWGSAESLTEVQVKQLSVRGVPLPPSDLTWSSSGGSSRISGSLLKGQGILDIRYHDDPKRLSSVHAELNQFDFAPILLLFNPRMIQDRELKARATGSVVYHFNSGSEDKGSGTVTLSEYELANSDTHIGLQSVTTVPIHNGGFRAPRILWSGRGQELALSLQRDQDQLKGQLSGKVDLALLEFFVPSIVHATGLAQVELGLSGTIGAPKLSGSIKTSLASVKVLSLDSPFENITSQIKVDQGVISLENLSSSLGGGRLFASGKVELFQDRYPEINLKALLSNTRIKVFPFQYAQVSGNIGVKGSSLPYLIDGALQIDNALSREKVMGRSQGGAGVRALPYAPPPTKIEISPASKFKLNISLKADKGIFVQNDLFRDMEVKGDLNLVNTFEVPRLLGKAEVIEGKLIFKDHVFQIKNATVNFDSTTEINPSFNLSANTEVGDVKIQMLTSGRIDNLGKIDFTSNPAMPEAEIISLLTVGFTSTDAKKLSSNDQNMMQQGEGTSLLLHSMDFNRDFEDKTGFQVQLDNSINPRQGVSALRPQSQADSAISPQITIRKKLGDRVHFSAGSTVGVGSARTNQVNLDYRVDDQTSVSGVYYYSNSGTADTQQPPSLGVDLKFQKRFK